MEDKKLNDVRTEFRRTIAKSLVTQKIISSKTIALDKKMSYTS